MTQTPDPLIDPVEVDPREFRRYDDDGVAYLELPDELPYDEAQCSGCGNPIGAWLNDRAHEQPQATRGERWEPTFRTPAGSYICDECVEVLK